MRFLTLTFLLGILGTANAQRFPFYENYRLQKNVQPIERETTDLTYYYNKYLMVVEYEYDELYQSFYKYETQHYRVKLNTDAAIEEFNKIYLSLEDVVNVKEIEARVIKPDRVEKVDIAVEEFYSEDEEEQYIYFPITGLELGDELEVFYVVKMEPAFNGDQFYFQGDVPIYDFTFHFIVPNDSYFNFLAHNDLPEPVLVDTILQRHQWDIRIDTVPALEAEYFSEYNNSIMKLDASLKGAENGAEDVYSPYAMFVDYANVVFNRQLTGKDRKMLTQLSSEIGVSRMNRQAKNVRLIENYMKNEFLIGYGQSGMSVAEMIKTGKGDGTGALILFMELLRQANIPFEYGLISDRYDTHFNAEIESNYFLQNYFFYFPEIKRYLAPLDFSTRLGFLDYQWVPNNALYLNTKSYPYTQTEHEVKAVPATGFADNNDSLVVRINVHENMEDADILVERHLTGYDAGEYQTYYYLFNDSRKKECHEDLLNFFNDNSKVKMTAINNVAVEDAFYKPLVIKGEIKELFTPIFEKAGEKTIFKLGNLFGEYLNPEELEKKQTDFVFGHPFHSSTTIIVSFPKNVQVSNAESIPQFDNLGKAEGVKVGSKLTLTDRQIIYHQNETFEHQRYAIDEKEELMKVFRFYSDLSKMNLIVE